jgi:hypothetical protein
MTASSQPSAAATRGHWAEERATGQAQVGPDDHQCSDSTQLSSSGALTAMLDFEVATQLPGRSKEQLPLSSPFRAGAGDARRLLSFVPFDGGVNVLEGPASTGCVAYLCPFALSDRRRHRSQSRRSIQREQKAETMASHPIHRPRHLLPRSVRCQDVP